MATISQCRYGQYTHGIPQYHDRSWYRIDTYTSHRDPSANGQDRLACVGRSDDTPIYQGRYDRTCACCWLGHGHTAAYHQQLVQAHTEAVARHEARAAAIRASSARRQEST